MVQYKIQLNCIPLAKKQSNYIWYLNDEIIQLEFKYKNSIISLDYFEQQSIISNYYNHCKFLERL